ncbi:alanine racemase [Thalassotalea atypica]|uniref:alanine racemase n=1 Tax=Thalassotalea atypica TaxID=2054316 RepID=UPI002574894A|nr:alanine racemase [Thalassotalea atypica]
MTVKTATAKIDLLALKNNLQAIKDKASNSKILAVLKANAYGHGLERIAKALCEESTFKDAFGVARIDEALALRNAGIVNPIVLLEGFFSAEDLAVISVNNLETVVHNQQQLDAILQAQIDKPLKVWLKVDTGMHRLGVSPEQFDGIYQQLVASQNVHVDIILMSHLSCADDTSSSRTTDQADLFERLTSDKHCQRSLANSAGICAWPETHYQWIRPGLMLYGVSPMEPELSVNAQALDIEPVMTLQASLIAKRKIAMGEAVGYGATWVADKETHIGVVAIGYGDGYPRHASNGTPVLLNGRIVPLVGRVSMDMITVDLGAESDDNIGDIATLWGHGLPVESVAQFATTIPYELLCNITRRVRIDVV